MNKTKIIINLWENGLTNSEIINKTGFDRKFIITMLNRKGLKSNKYPIIEEDNNIKQLIIGSMLGDGYMEKIDGASKNSRLSIAHCLNQVEYIKWKHDILSQYGLVGKLSKSKHNDNRYNDGFIEEYRFRSKTHPIFTTHRNLYYPNGYKSIINKVTKEINELGLCIWYMDDGNVTSSSFEFNTQSFSEEENSFLIEILKDKFELNSYINKRNLIVIRGQSKELFKSIIEKNILDSMRYKILTYRDRL